MTLQERATRISAAAIAEESDAASHDLLTRGQQISHSLQSARLMATDAAGLREEFGFSAPKMDPKALAKRLGALERRLADKSLAAVDGKDAANAQEEASAFSKRLIDWAGKEWSSHHKTAAEAIKAVDESDLQGRPETVQDIRNKRRRLLSILNYNPLSDRATLLQSLDAEDLVAASAAIGTRAQALSDLVTELRGQAADFSPAVKTALVAAASDAGLPLKRVSAELLAELIEAGVAETLTVHS